MKLRQPLAIAATLLGVLGATAVWAQRGAEAQGEAAPPRQLDPEVQTVRLLLGIGDTQTRTWGGRVKLDRGEVLGVEGYRFRKGDRATARDAWEAQSRRIRKNAAKKAAAKAKATANPAQGAAFRPSGPGTAGPAITPNGVLVSIKAPADATLSVETERGSFQVPLADLAGGASRRYLDGRAEAQRLASGVPLRDTAAQEDFPAAAADREGGVWVAYVVHQPRGPEVLESFRERPKSFAEFAPSGGGDQVRLLRFAGGKAGESIDVTEPGLDLWRPAVAIDRDGKVVVAWSENEDGNWDIHRRTYDPQARSWSEIKRLTSNPGADTDVVLAGSPEAGIYMAWQSWQNGQADILLADADGKAAPTHLTATAANEWSPSIAIRNNHIYVTYDTYENGSYDVKLYDAVAGSGAAGRTVKVAASSKYEARPTVAVDGRGRAWVAYEERNGNWGKDAENLVEGQGSSLYRSAAVRVRSVEGDRVTEAPDPISNAPEALRSLNSYPRLAVDRDGRVWLTFRHKQEAIWGNNAVMVVGGVWVEYATALAGAAWDAPRLLPRSDGLLDNRPALVVPGDGPVLAFYSTDGRLRHEVEFTPELMQRYWAHSGTPGNPDGSFNEDLQVAALSPWTPGGTVEPATAAVSAAGGSEPPVHPNEAADIARMRGYRVQAGGKSYRLLRGDFHRHTEISQDGGSDGSLEDMWRYAIDAAGFDWMGNEDHDNGGGKEYTWWLVQKTTDMYNHTNFPTMFTYERSVTYPHGHRNVMFAKRGVRTLPRLVDSSGVVDADTLMLYDYLKEHGGLCASHTSGTGMGTDWRDVDPTFEPLVEIYQGHRNSYEHLGAPRVARRPAEAIGGWRPLGMVWNALALQYRFGFQASSDHISTHISYAVAVAEDATREAVFDAFKRRHCYGATDNIVLDVRSGDHLMGDEFRATGPVQLKIHAHGTRPIARVDIIKDFQYAFSTEPKTPQVSFEWRDDEKRPAGLSWYYVRVIQDDGQIAWGSPMWVHLPSTAAGQ